MQFTGSLPDGAQARVEGCNLQLNDPARLAALARTGLMNSPRDAAFDRLAHLAAKILKAPLTIISFVGDDKQFFMAGHGLPAPLDTIREIPIEGSICRYTLQGEAIIADDAQHDPLLQFHPATGPWGIGSFIAIPMITRDQQVLGAFCAVHPEPHHWTPDEVYVMEQLTASVMTEVELREQVAELTAERELRERFVLTLTHDLRSPLTSSKLNAQLIARGRADGSAARDVASKIDLHLNRADRMIQNLLDANLLKAGQTLPIVKRPFHLDALAKNLLADFVTLYGDRIRGSIAPDLEVNWDASAYQRMLENLVTNASKYGDSKAEISVTIAPAGNWIETHVHNFGNPIEPNDQDRIFEIFQRTTDAREGGVAGWGLGLATVRSLARAHGGDVTVTSDKINGTRFTIKLPLERH